MGSETEKDDLVLTTLMVSFYTQCLCWVELLPVLFFFFFQFWNYTQHKGFWACSSFFMPALFTSRRKKTSHEGSRRQTGYSLRCLDGISVEVPRDGLPAHGSYIGDTGMRSEASAAFQILALVVYHLILSIISRQ